MRLPAARVMAHTRQVPSRVILWEPARGAPVPPIPVPPGVDLTMAARLRLPKEATPAPAQAP